MTIKPQGYEMKNIRNKDLMQKVLHSIRIFPDSKDDCSVWKCWYDSASKQWLGVSDFFGLVISEDDLEKLGKSMDSAS